MFIYIHISDKNMPLHPDSPLYLCELPGLLEEVSVGRIGLSVQVGESTSLELLHVVHLIKGDKVSQGVHGSVPLLPRASSHVCGNVLLEVGGEDEIGDQCGGDVEEGADGVHIDGGTEGTEKGRRREKMRFSL